MGDGGEVNECEGFFFKLILKKFRDFLLSIPGVRSMSATCPRTPIYTVVMRIDVTAELEMIAEAAEYEYTVGRLLMAFWIKVLR